MEKVIIPISFPIPLETTLEATKVHVIEENEEGKEGCEGGTAAAPIAERGNLCIYITFGAQSGVKAALISNVLSSEALAPGAGRGGAVILTGEFFGLKEGATGFGDWVVKAP